MESNLIEQAQQWMDYRPSTQDELDFHYKKVKLVFANLLIAAQKQAEEIASLAAKLKDRESDIKDRLVGAQIHAAQNETLKTELNEKLEQIRTLEARLAKIREALNG